MPYVELLKWVSFFNRRPIGWREDQRTYMLLSAQGLKEEPEALFPSLKALKEGIPTDRKALPKGKFLEMMLTAKEGDSSQWKPPWMKGNK